MLYLYNIVHHLGELQLLISVLGSRHSMKRGACFVAMDPGLTLWVWGLGFRGLGVQSGRAFLVVRAKPQGVVTSSCRAKASTRPDPALGPASDTPNRILMHATSETLGPKSCMPWPLVQEPFLNLSQSV